MIMPGHSRSRFLMLQYSLTPWLDTTESMIGHSVLVLTVHMDMPTHYHPVKVSLVLKSESSGRASNTHLCTLA